MLKVNQRPQLLLRQVSVYVHATDGHKQTTKTSTKIQTKRTKKHRTTEEEMEGPTSSEGSRNRLTCLNLQEHHHDDEILQ